MQDLKKMENYQQLIFYHWMAHKMNNSDQDSSNNVTCCQIKMIVVKFWLNIQIAYLQIFFQDICKYFLLNALPIRL